MLLFLSFPVNDLIHSRMYGNKKLRPLQKHALTSEMPKISEISTVIISQESDTLKLPLIINSEVEKPSDGSLSEKTDKGLSNSCCRLSGVRIVTILFPAVVIGVTILTVVFGKIPFVL